MKSFLKYTLATIVGIIVSSILLFLLLLGVIGAIVVSSDSEESAKPNTILHIRLSAEIPERTSENPFEDFSITNYKPSVKLGLNDIIKNIESAKDDDNVKGIYLDLSIIPSGWATIEEIRNALLDFKKSKKFIISYSDIYTQKAYYLASTADSIFLNPQGELLFLGLRSEQLFFKGSLDKLEIEPQIFRHGKFKSAVEPFMSDKMSNENREQLTSLLNGIWGHVLKGISEKRKISVTQLNTIADKLIIRNAQSALDNKMIDGLQYKDQVLERLVKLSGVSNEKKLELVELSKYNKVTKSSGSKSDKKVAVIYASGEINLGGDDEKAINSDKLSKTIRDARKDSTIAAIVLRINSPGGSSLASEIIWRELDLAAKVKPLIVSMGSLAASGGYYIASPAQVIVADPTTITGSIGVFGLTFNTKNFLNKKLGITTDVAKTNQFADAGSVFRAVSPEEREVLQAEVEHVYDVFVSRVANGRKLSKLAVDSIGQGRVWSAIDARRIGLVDSIGGLGKAISIASKKAKLSNYQTIELPKQDNTFTSLLKDFSAKMSSKAIKNELGDEYMIYNNLKKMRNMQGIQSRMPFEISIY